MAAEGDFGPLTSVYQYKVLATALVRCASSLTDNPQALV